ncbi:hypothetical protein M3Y97_00566900 [Aphelenchoides bicaudatus]|nr:hypothetical protein M3Y97_00566900 [Aphelenchoides bicaudatus]
MGTPSYKLASACLTTLLMFGCVTLPLNALDTTSSSDADFSLISEDAKECKKDFQCWKTEPVIDGVPLELYGRINKRVSIGAGLVSRGARCRCVKGTCSFYIFTSKRFLACQEF